MPEEEMIVSDSRKPPEPPEPSVPMLNTYDADIMAVAAADPEGKAAPYPLPRVDLNLLPDVDKSKLPQSPIGKPRSKGL